MAFELASKVRQDRCTERKTDKRKEEQCDRFAKSRSN